MLFFYNLLYSQQGHIDIEFEKTSTKISPSSSLKLDSCINNIQRNSVLTEINIEAFPNKDQALVDKRIAEIQSSLENYDLRIQTIHFYTEIDHIDFEIDEASLQNLIRISYQFKQFIPLVKDSKSTSIIAESQSKTYFISSNKKDVSVYLEQGSILEIPPNAFVNLRGVPYQGEVAIKALEVLNPIDAINANINTNYEDGFLESRGMLKIEAFSLEGDTLQLAKNKNIRINIPKSNRFSNKNNANQNEFQNFRGVSRGEKLSWVLTNNTVTTKKIPKKKRYILKKMPEVERAEIEKERDEIIDKWLRRGLRKKLVKERLKRYKKNRKRRLKRLKRKKGRREYKIKYTKSNRDYEKITKFMILANSKRRWYRDTVPKNNPYGITQYYSTSMIMLGLINIDRVFKKKITVVDLKVQNANHQTIKVIFLDNFIVLDGEQVGDNVLFRAIPEGERLLILSTKSIDDKISIGHLLINAINDLFIIKEFQLISNEELQKTISKLLN